MIDRYKPIVLAVALAGFLSLASCGKGEKVHESWKIPDPQAVVDDSTLNSSIQGALKADPEVRHLDVRVEAPEDARNRLLISIACRIRDNNAALNLVYPFFLDEGVGVGGDRRAN